jgi:hypothetical protein
MVFGWGVQVLGAALSATAAHAALRPFALFALPAKIELVAASSAAAAHSLDAAPAPQDRSNHRVSSDGRHATSFGPTKERSCLRLPVEVKVTHEVYVSAT